MNRPQRNTPGTPGSSYASRLASNSPRSPHDVTAHRTVLSPKPNGGGAGVGPREHNRSGFLAKLDAQVFTDTQSRGLTSRLASYYERERRPTPIVNRLYNKAGEFPVVHFQRNELTNSPRRSGGAALLNASVRIPVPERSTYQSTLRSEILRTGAVTGNVAAVGPASVSVGPTSSAVPLPSGPSGNVNAGGSGGDDNANAMAPLDALKEISRKRIHCEETTTPSSIDSYKKQRADEIAEATVQWNAQQNAQGKRMRDKSSPTYQNTATTAKQKRPCTKNHDVLSSLSSSIRWPAAVQRKVPSPAAAATAVPKPSTEPQHCKQPAVALNVAEANAQDLPDSSFNGSTRTDEAERRSNHHLRETPDIENASASETVPKLTLFNKRYPTMPPVGGAAVSVTQASDSTLMSKGSAVSDDDNDDNEGSDCGIAYVKPRKAARTGELSDADKSTNPARRPAQSKLALMLSCLSGDLDDDDDQVDAPIVNSGLKANAAPAKTIDAVVDNAEPTGTARKEESKTSTDVAATDKPTTIDSVVSKSPASPTVTTVPAAAATFSFGLSKNATTDSPPKPASNVASVPSNAAEEKKKGGFAFNLSASVEKPTAPVTASTSPGQSIPAQVVTTSLPLPVFGAAAAVNPSTAIVTTASSVATMPQPAPTFAFGASSSSSVATTTTTAATSSVAAAAVASPPKGGFSFSSSNSTTAPTFAAPKPDEPPSTTTTSATAASAFSFGLSKIPVATQPSAAAISTNMFGNIGAAGASVPATNVVAPTTTTFSAAPSTAALSFGSFTASSGAAPSVAPLFGSAMADKGASSSSSSSAAFTFGGVAAGAAATSSTAAPTATTTASTSGIPVFGGASSTLLSGPTPTFGQTAAAAAAAVNSVAPTNPLLFATNNSSSMFAASVTTAAPAAQTAAAASPSFTFGKTTTTSAPFSFGASASSSNNTTAPPNGSNSGFSGIFGAATATGGNNTVAGGTSTTSSSTPFAFGGGGGAGGQAATNISTFAAPVQQQQQSAPNAFGAASNNTTAPVFGSNNTAAASPIFGSNSAASTSTAAPPMFGSAASTGQAAQAAPAPIFGSTSLGGGATTAMFGSASSSSTSNITNGNAPVFGSSATNALSTFGSTATVAPIFGGGSTAPNSTAPPAFGSSAMGTSTFGGLNAGGGGGAAAPSTTPSFGGLASNNNANSITGSTSIFGAAANNATAAQPFAFGGSSSSAASPPVFGSAVNQLQQQQQQSIAAAPSAAFSFGGTSSATNNTAAAPSAGASFSFGGLASSNAASSAASAASSSFGFGGTGPSSSSAAPPNVTAPFSFGASSLAIKIPLATFGAGSSSIGSNASSGASAINNGAPFAFGQSSAGATSAGVNPPAGAVSSSPFSFGGGGGSSGVSTPLPQTGGAFNFGAASPGTNLFAATPSGGGAKGRPIRQATRRINK